MANTKINLNKFPGYANLAAGTYNLTLVAKATGYSDSPASEPVSITVPNNTFANMTWAEVIAACNNHTLSQIRGAVVGATKNITIEGIDYPFVILGFEHDTLTTPDTHGTKAHCTFQMLHCYKTSQKMNSSNTNTGGWGASALRSYLNGTFKALLPAQITSAMKSIHKPYLATYNSDTISYCDDAIYIPSEYEIFGVGRSTSGATYTSANVYAYNIEGAQYPYYQQSPIPAGFTQIGNTGSFTGNGGSYLNRYGENKSTTNGYVYNYNAVRGLTGSSGETPSSSTGCWESSPYYGSSNSFCYVNTSGSANLDVASFTFGVAPAFSL